MIAGESLMDLREENNVTAWVYHGRERVTIYNT